MRSALLLEDYAPMRGLLTHVLQSAFKDIQIIEAETVRQAGDLLRGHTFNLALVDLGLPDGSGIEIIETLSRHHPHTYAVVSTMFDDDQNLFSALRAGAKGYVLKEEAPSQLIALLQGILEGNPPLSPGIARRIIAHFHNLPSDPPPPFLLSPRERDVLRLIARGMQRKEIARELNISLHTACDYIKDIYRKLEVSSRAEAAEKAITFKL